MTKAAFHQLVPEEPGIVPTVRIDALWNDIVDAIEASPAKDRLFWSNVEREVYAERYRVQETAAAIFNICLRNKLLAPRINSGAGFYRVPGEAFIPRFESAHGMPNADVTTWSTGVLNRIDTTERYEWIADGGYALLVTTDEAGLARQCARHMIVEAEREEKGDQRASILNRAFRGEIGAKEAEAVAMRCGLEPLASRPLPSEFDPRQEAAWTLPMALAWIAWRSFEEVRAWDSAYRHECLDWTTSDDHPNGRRLKRRDAATVFEFETMGYLMWSERERGHTDREFDDHQGQTTKRLLWLALQEGDVEAAGIPSDGGPRRAIPAIEWQDLEDYRDQRTGREHVRYRQRPDLGAAYFEVSLSRSQIIERWPEGMLGEAPAPALGSRPEVTPATVLDTPRLGRPATARKKVRQALQDDPSLAEKTDKQLARAAGVSPRSAGRHRD